MPGAEPEWARRLPDGQTIAECTAAIDMLVDVLRHYRRKRHAMMSSVRMMGNRMGGSRGLPPMTLLQRSHYKLLTQSKRLSRADALKMLFPSAGVPAPADCGALPSTAAPAAVQPSSLGGGRIPLVRPKVDVKG
jgi:hypothetical protein